MISSIIHSTLPTLTRRRFLLWAFFTFLSQHSRALRRLKRPVLLLTERAQPSAQSHPCCGTCCRVAHRAAVENRSCKLDGCCCTEVRAEGPSHAGCRPAHRCYSHPQPRDTRGKPPSGLLGLQGCGLLDLPSRAQRGPQVQSEERPAPGSPPHLDPPLPPFLKRTHASSRLCR